MCSGAVNHGDRVVRWCIYKRVCICAPLYTHTSTRHLLSYLCYYFNARSFSPSPSPSAMTIFVIKARQAAAATTRRVTTAVDGRKTRRKREGEGERNSPNTLHYAVSAGKVSKNSRSEASLKSPSLTRIKGRKARARW